MTITAYLAGPDVVLPDAVEHAARKVAICLGFGFRVLPPLNQNVGDMRRRGRAASMAALALQALFPVAPTWEHR